MPPYLVDVPVESGGRLLVQAVATDDLQLAGPEEGIRRISQTLEHSLDEVRPALDAVIDRLGRSGPDEIEVEFGLILGVEAGIVVAKGSSEVHFTVTLSWKRHDPPAG